MHGERFTNCSVEEPKADNLETQPKLWFEPCPEVFLAGAYELATGGWECRRNVGKSRLLNHANNYQGFERPKQGGAREAELARKGNEKRPPIRSLEANHLRVEERSVIGNLIEEERAP